MPRVTIWIREEDYPKWKAIDDKPKQLHEWLNHEKSFRSMDLNEQVQKIHEIMKDEPTITEPEETA